MTTIYLIFIHKGISLNNLKLVSTTLIVLTVGFGFRLAGSAIFETEVMKIVNYVILGIRSIAIFFCIFYSVKSE